jgi:hypothetical protein
LSGEADKSDNGAAKTNIVVSELDKVMGEAPAEEKIGNGF